MISYDECFFVDCACQHQAPRLNRHVSFRIMILIMFRCLDFSYLANVMSCLDVVDPKYIEPSKYLGGSTPWMRTWIHERGGGRGHRSGHGHGHRAHGAARDSRTVVYFSVGGIFISQGKGTVFAVFQSKSYQH